MIPKAEDMRLIAEAVERDVDDRVGWDVPAVLGIVLRKPRDESTDVTIYGVLPYPVQPIDVDPSPGQAMLTLGSMLRYPDPGDTPPSIVPKSVERDFAGLIFVAEAYGMVYDTPAERDAETRAFADVPGARELRFAVLVDCGGRVHFADRYRGSEPTVTTARPGDSRWHAGGNVIIGLRDMMVAIGRQVPFGTMDLDAVASIAREDEP